MSVWNALKEAITVKENPKKRVNKVDSTEVLSSEVVEERSDEKRSDEVMEAEVKKVETGEEVKKEDAEVNTEQVNAELLGGLETLKDLIQCFIDNGKPIALAELGEVCKNLSTAVMNSIKYTQGLEDKIEAAAKAAEVESEELKSSQSQIAALEEQINELNQKLKEAESNEEKDKAAVYCLNKQMLFNQAEFDERCEILGNKSGKEAKSDKIFKVRQILYRHKSGKTVVIELDSVSCENGFINLNTGTMVSESAYKKAVKRGVKSYVKADSLTVTTETGDQFEVKL